MKQKSNSELSPHGILLKEVKKAYNKFDPELSSGLEYKFMDLIEADIKKRELFELKISAMDAIRELMKQYRHLFTDYCTASGIADTEKSFRDILKYPDSAYNKAAKTIESISKLF